MEMKPWSCVYFTIFAEPDISQKDPRWVGAWWLGFVICSLCSFTLAIPLVFFPARFKEEDEASSRAKVSQLDVTSQTKGSCVFIVLQKIEPTLFA